MQIFSWLITPLGFWAVSVFFSFTLRIPQHQGKPDTSILYKLHNRLCLPPHHLLRPSISHCTAHPRRHILPTHLPGDRRNILTPSASRGFSPASPSIEGLSQHLTSIFYLGSLVELRPPSIQSSATTHVQNNVQKEMLHISFSVSGIVTSSITTATLLWFFWRPLKGSSVDSFPSAKGERERERHPGVIVRPKGLSKSFSWQWGLTAVACSDSLLTPVNLSLHFKYQLFDKFPQSIIPPHRATQY